MRNLIKLFILSGISLFLTVSAQAGPYVQFGIGGATVIGADDNASLDASTGTSTHLGFGYRFALVGVEVFANQMKTTLTLADASIADTEFDRDVTAVGGGLRLFLWIFSLRAGVANFDVEQSFSSADTATENFFNDIIPLGARDYSKSGAYFGVGAAIGLGPVDVLLDLNVYTWKEDQFVAGSTTVTEENTVGNTEAVVGVRYSF